MTMPACRTCGNTDYFAKRSWYENGDIQDICNACGDFSTTGIPDVFFKTAYKSEALGVEFTSKGQKAQYLKDHGLTEAGDVKMSTKSWVEGTREYSKRQFEKRDRPLLRKAIHEWRERARR